MTTLRISNDELEEMFGTPIPEGHSVEVVWSNSLREWLVIITGEPS